MKASLECLVATYRFTHQQQIVPSFDTGLDNCESRMIHLPASSAHHKKFYFTAILKAVE
jgi:hypothetical protein